MPRSVAGWEDLGEEPSCRRGCGGGCEVAAVGSRLCARDEGGTWRPFRAKLRGEVGEGHLAGMACLEASQERSEAEVALVVGVRVGGFAALRRVRRRGCFGDDDDARTSRGEQRERAIQ